jgi:hypothetical protein
VADTPLRPLADPQWEELHAAAAAEEATVARVFYLALSALTARAILLRFRDAIARRDVDNALLTLPMERILQLATTLAPIFERTAEAGAAIARAARPQSLDTDTLIRLGTNAGLPVGELRDYARAHAAELVRDITIETRYAIRRIVERAVHRGTVPRETARLIEQVVGLNSRQAEALWRYGEALREAGIQPSRIAQLTGRRATAMLRQRALVIARHETMQAANAGRRAVWERDLLDGNILGHRWEREWVAIVPNDGRTCPYCVGQDGQRAPIGGTYPDGSDGPPGHVICRCTEKLVRAA